MAISQVSGVLAISEIPFASDICLQEYASLLLQFQLRAAQCSWATEQQSGRDRTGHKSTNESVSGIARLFPVVVCG